MVTLGSAIAGLICHLMYRSQSIYSMLGGMVFGGVVFLFSLASGGKIGPGDGIVFMLTGLYLGVEKNLALMLIAFMLAGFWGLIAILVLHRDKKEKIPFIPFLFLAYLLILIM